jgi:hypothetical protein
MSEPNAHGVLSKFSRGILNSHRAELEIQRKIACFTTRERVDPIAPEQFSEEDVYEAESEGSKPEQYSEEDGAGAEMDPIAPEQFSEVDVYEAESEGSKPEPYSEEDGAGAEMKQESEEVESQPEGSNPGDLEEVQDVRCEEKELWLPGASNVRKIVGSRHSIDNKLLLFLVLWDESDVITWEPPESVGKFAADFNKRVSDADPRIRRFGGDFIDVKYPHAMGVDMGIEIPWRVEVQPTSGPVHITHASGITGGRRQPFRLSKSRLRCPLQEQRWALATRGNTWKVPSRS